MPRDMHHWTHANRALLVELREDCGLSWCEVAERIPGTTWGGCAAQYSMIREARLKKGRYARGTEAEKCPNKVLIERDQREAATLARNEAMAGRGDMTFLLGGMPPPGRSALDQKRRAAP